MPHIERCFAVLNDGPQYGRCLGILEVESHQEGLFHNGQRRVAPAAQRALPASRRVGRCACAPQGVVGADQKIDASLVVRRLEQ